MLAGSGGRKTGACSNIAPKQAVWQSGITNWAVETDNQYARCVRIGKIVVNQAFDLCLSNRGTRQFCWNYGVATFIHDGCLGLLLFLNDRDPCFWGQSIVEPRIWLMFGLEQLGIPLASTRVFCQ